MTRCTVAITDLAPALRTLLGRARKIRRAIVIRATAAGSVSLSDGQRAAQVPASGGWTGAVTLSPAGIAILRDVCRHSPEGNMIIEGQSVMVGGATIPVADATAVATDPDGGSGFGHSPVALLRASFAGDADRLRAAGLGAELSRAEAQCATAVAAAARCLAPLAIPVGVVKAAVERAVREHDDRGPEQPSWMKYVLQAEASLTSLGLKPGSLQTAVHEYLRSTWLQVALPVGDEPLGATEERPDRTE